jgi:hypothetical protein
MNQLKKALLVLAATLALTAALPASDAQAARIPIVYQSGDDIFEAGDGSLPAPWDKEPELAGAKAGYRCDVFGLFGAYFTISDCEPVAFKGDTFWNEPELAKAVATAHPEDSMKVSAWQKHGRFLVGLLGLGLIGFGIWGQMKGGDDDDDEEEEGATA